MEQDLVRRRDRLVVKLQSFISEYQQIQQENCELRQKNIELQQSCDDMVHTLTVKIMFSIDEQEQSTIIQELEENVDESTKEKERTELLQYKQLLIITIELKKKTEVRKNETIFYVIYTVPQSLLASWIGQRKNAFES